MNTQYFKQYSSALNRDMEWKVYGHGGRPVLYIPCQDGRFYDFEDFHMSDIWAPWIDSGEVCVFSIDTIDRETWSDTWGNADYRSALYESWIHYITEEMVPFIRGTLNIQTPHPGILVTGCSLGAGHAANLFFRFPDIFDGLLALSGLYTAEYGFGTFMNDLVYQNSPVHYLDNMPSDHPYISLYNQNKAIICTGQGPWEAPDYTRRLDQILCEKGIHAWFDYWGYDSSHDWYWWYKQAAYFIPYILENK